MTDLAQLGLALDAKPMLKGLEDVDKALLKTSTAAEALATKIKTATGQMAAAFSKVKEGGAEKQAAGIEKLNFAIEHQARAYQALLSIMREDSAIAKSSAAQRILLNSAFASSTAEIDKATVAGAKNLAGLRAETAVTTSLAVAQGGLTESEKRLLDAKTRKNIVVKNHVDSVRAEIAASIKQAPLADAHVAALRREEASIKAVSDALAKQRVAQERAGSGIVAAQRRQNATLGLSAAPKDLFTSFAEDPKVQAALRDKAKLAPLADAHVAALRREEAAVRSLMAAERDRIQAALSKQAMEMRMHPILSTGSTGLPTKATSAFNAAPDPGPSLSGIASVDKMRASLKDVAARTTAASEALSAGSITRKEYAREMDEVTKATNLATSGNTRARGVFRQTASAIASATFEITGAVFGLTAAMGILTAPAAFGFKLLATMEDTKLALSSILISMGLVNGEAIKLPKALELANGVTQRLQQNALKYGLDIKALGDTTKAVLSSGLGGGLKLKEVEEIALLGTIAVKNIGLEAKQSVQEIRDLVAGGIQAGSSQLAVALGISNADVKRWREAKTLFINLKTAMSGFQDTAILKQDTLTGAWTIFVQKVQLLFANSAAFDTFKAKLTEISNALGKINEETGKFEFNPGLVVTVDAYFASLKSGIATVSALGKAVLVLSPIFKALGVVLNEFAAAGQITFGSIAAFYERGKEVFKGNFAEADKIWANWKAEARTIKREANETEGAILGMSKAAAAPVVVAPSAPNLGFKEVTDKKFSWNTKLKGIYDPDNVTGKPQTPVVKTHADPYEPVHASVEKLFTELTKLQDTQKAVSEGRYTSIAQIDAVKSVSDLLDGLKGKTKAAFEARLAKDFAQQFKNAGIAGGTLRDRLVELVTKENQYKDKLNETNTALQKRAEDTKSLVADMKSLSDFMLQLGEESDVAEAQLSGKAAARYAKSLKEIEDTRRKGMDLINKNSVFGDASHSAEKTAAVNDLNAALDRQAEALKKLDDFNSLKDRLGVSTGIISSTDTSLQSQVVSGLISEAEARAKLRSVTREQAAALGKDLLPQIRAVMATVTDPAKLAEMQQMIDKIGELAAVGKQEGALAGFEQGVKDFANSAVDSFETVRGATTKAFKGMEDALIEFVTTGKLNFKDLAGSIIKDMIRIEIQRSLSPILSGLGKAAISIIGNAFGGGGGGAVDPSSYAAGNEYAAAVANGGVFSNGNLTAFAKGGVVGGPTTFPMAQGGIGLMGEAGPEAVMPLKRGSDGKLGIASSGGGSGDVAVSITINDNRTQTETKSGGSDASKAPKVAEMIKSVVHAKLIQEMRPGGLLA